LATPLTDSRPHFTQTRASRSLVAVDFQHVTKTYRLYRSPRDHLRSLIWPVPHQMVHANRDLSFTINHGESVALLGRNGAGKSTALKIITGVTTPNTGEVAVHGRVSALLDIGAGFDDQLTGRANLIMRGRLWGLSQRQIVARLDDIIDFADIGPYIDQPMRTYSSGMRARLGFSFSASLNPDILILDEVMSVGDREFAAKSSARMREIIAREGLTLLFVTHSLETAAQFCHRAIVIDHGSAHFDGPIEAGLDFYRRLSDGQPSHDR
jgi:teichoic acid transport system ATP-binding protein